MSQPPTLDALWLLFSAVLVLVMQCGFLCLESGLTRSKNAINVALKNALDLLVTSVLYWGLGFGIMFGAHRAGVFDTGLIAADFTHGGVWVACFFLFQLTFCATAATIVSGAIAERSRFVTYVALTALLALLLYPVFGHLAWGGALSGLPGWLAARGFVDFAGSTVVHSLGGWVALAAIIVVGPRDGRFEGGEVRDIPGSNLPFAMLGMLFFMIGWIGFNGGSALAFSPAIPAIIANTLLAGATGGVIGMLLGHLGRPGQGPAQTINGTLAGLVAITASCHAVTTPEALVIGGGGALCMRFTEQLLLRWRLDDAIGAVPVHLGAGIWGTLAVALFGDPAILGTGLGYLGQLGAQLLGIVLCGLWALLLTLLFLRIMGRMTPLRVSTEAEQEGLNSSEHGATTELTQLLQAMNEQESTGDMRLRVPVEPFTEVGQIARKYNRVMARLERMVKRTHLILRDMRDGVITFSELGIVTSANPGAEQIFGRPSQQLIGIPVADLLHEDCRNLYPNIARENLMTVIAAGRREGPNEIAGRCSSGAAVPIEVIATASPTGEGVQYSAVLRDISERKRMEAQLYQHSQLAQVTLEAITEAVITCDGQMRTVYLNPVASLLTGWSNKEAFEQPVENILKLRSTGNEPVSLWSLRDRGEAAEAGQLELTGRQGERAIVQCNLAPLKDTGGKSIGWLIALRDVTHSNELQARLTFQAVHDALTGLLNRREFERRLEQLMIAARTDLSEHLLCYLDLDQFKIVNDTCGHRAGDNLLRQLSRLIREHLRQSDTFARLGGDEFGILLANCPATRGLEIAEQIRTTVKDFRFFWDEQVFSVGVSIGMVPVNAESGSLDELLSTADAACYAAKDGGRNRVHFYASGDEELQHRKGQMHWASSIQQAIDEDRLRLFYQPIEPLASPSRAPHFEILVRMLDDRQQTIPPTTFIPAAERYGLMPLIDQWVIRNTLAWLGDNLRVNNRQLCCSINLSGTSIGSQECLDLIKQLIEQHRIPAHYLCFEITETAAMSDLEAARRFIRELTSLGCQFALDDFGSGLSSFGYLRSLDVDYLKIDSIFVRDLCKSEVDQAIVASINNIAHIMGLKTVAEFVEDTGTLELLRQIGVDHVQGYLLGKPQPLEYLGQLRMMPR
ncbi:MAG: diguanylate cyclase [Haliea sp.]|nr:diguanylate cyclase [Haliea sp.]